MQYYVLLNKIAGNGSAGNLYDEIYNVIHEKLQRDFIMFKSDSLEASESFLRNISKGIKQGDEKNHIIISIGGDGTLNQTLNFLINLKRKQSIPLSHLSVGSGNDFARSVHQTNWKQHLLKTLNNPKIKIVNLGLIKEKNINHYFINSFGIGFDAQVVYENQTSKNKEKLNKLNLGFLSYYLAIINVLKKRYNFNVEFDNKKYLNRFLLVIGNNKFFGGGIPILPNSSIFKKDLELISTKNISTIKFIWMFINMFCNGHHLKMKDIDYLKFQKGVLKIPKENLLQVDGEIYKNVDPTLEISTASYPIIF
jgi:YegS/Rv2252/BmrU family lipid kinase